MQPRSYCEQTIDALRTGSAPWFLEVQATPVVGLLNQYAEQELSGFEFEWRLRLASIAAERSGDPARASAARSILRHWRRQADYSASMPNMGRGKALSQRPQSSRHH